MSLVGQSPLGPNSRPPCPCTCTPKSLLLCELGLTSIATRCAGCLAQQHRCTSYSRACCLVNASSRAVQLTQCLVQSQDMHIVVASRAPLANLKQVTWVLCITNVLCKQTAMAAQPLTVLQELNKGIKIPSSCVGVERQGCQHGSAQVWPVDGPKHVCHRQVVFVQPQVPAMQA